MITTFADLLEPLVRHHSARVPSDIDCVENVLIRIHRSINQGPFGPFPTAPWLPDEVFQMVRPTLARLIRAMLEKDNVIAKQERLP